MSADCHADCVIGPHADHHGTMSYRCMDANLVALPFPGEDFSVMKVGGLQVYIFEDY